MWWSKLQKETGIGSYTVTNLHYWISQWNRIKTDGFNFVWNYAFCIFVNPKCQSNLVLEGDTKLIIDWVNKKCYIPWPSMKATINDINWLAAQFECISSFLMFLLKPILLWIFWLTFDTLPLSIIFGRMVYLFLFYKFLILTFFILIIVDNLFYNLFFL